MPKNPCAVIGTGFTAPATRCLVLRPDLSRIIPRTIETGWAALFPCALETRHLGNRRAANDFYRKKSLPWFVIFGIPRARAGTTNLLSASNCIRFGDVQRRREGAEASPGHVGERQPQ